MFKEEYDKYSDIKKGDIVKILGKVEKRHGEYQIIVSRLEKLNLEDSVDNADHI